MSFCRDSEKPSKGLWYVILHCTSRHKHQLINKYRLVNQYRRIFHLVMKKLQTNSLQVTLDFLQYNMEIDNVARCAYIHYKSNVRYAMGKIKIFRRDHELRVIQDSALQVFCREQGGQKEARALVVSAAHPLKSLSNTFGAAFSLEGVKKILVDIYTGYW